MLMLIAAGYHSGVMVSISTRREIVRRYRTVYSFRKEIDEEGAYTSQEAAIYNLVYA
jgi:hypothetical protein